MSKLINHLLIIILSLGTLSAQNCPVVAHYTGGSLSSNNVLVGDGIGEKVAGVGDQNGDRVGDYAVLATRDIFSEVNTAPQIRIYSGKTHQIIRYLSPPNNGEIGFGSAIGSPGDWNNDGFPEVFIGSNNALTDEIFPGRVYIFSGKNGQLLFTIKTGKNQNDYFGTSVINVGDINLDGFDDLVIGAPEDPGKGCVSCNDSIGIVYVLSGQTRGLMSAFSAPKAKGFKNFGEVLANVGDINGDSINDLFVADPTWNQNRGYGVIYSGGAIASQAISSLVAFSGSDPESYLGAHASKIGDLDRDGKSEFMIGVPGNQNSAQNFGQIAILKYRADLTSRFQILKEFFGNSSENYGLKFSGLGDVNLDGYPDLMIASWISGVNNSNFQDHLKIYSGLDFSELYKFYSPSNHPGDFGSAIAPLGDSDGDGSIEFVIGDFASMDGVNFEHITGNYQSDPLRDSPGSVSVYSISADHNLNKIPDHCERNSQLEELKLKKPTTLTAIDHLKAISTTASLPILNNKKLQKLKKKNKAKFKKIKSAQNSILRARQELSTQIRYLLGLTAAYDDLLLKAVSLPTNSQLRVLLNWIDRLQQNSLNISEIEWLAKEIRDL